MRRSRTISQEKAPGPALTSDLLHESSAHINHTDIYAAAAPFHASPLPPHSNCSPALPTPPATGVAWWEV